MDQNPDQDQDKGKGKASSGANASGADGQQNTTILTNILGREHPTWILAWNDTELRDGDGRAYWLSELIITLPDNTTLSYTAQGRRRGHARDQVAYEYLIAHGFRAREPLEAD